MLRFLFTHADTVAVVHESYAGPVPDCFVVTGITPPSADAPGRSVCPIDDFSVEPTGAWPRVGGVLLDAAVAEDKRCGAPLTSIVAPHPDARKRAFLASCGFTVTSEEQTRWNDEARGRARYHGAGVSLFTASAGDSSKRLTIVLCKSSRPSCNVFIH